MRGGFLIKILICDDNKEILTQINQLITSYAKSHKANFDIDLRSSGDFIFDGKGKYDIAFIDIEMPGISGLRLSEELKRQNPDVLVIIITSFQSYLDSAMKIKVFRYLSKPIDINRFKNNFIDALKEHQSINKSILINQKDEVFFVKTSDILYIENKRFGSIMVTKNGEYKTNKKLSEWIKTINQPNCFVHSHSSYIVNLQNVVSFNKTSVTLRKSKDEVVTAYVSQRKYSTFKKAFFNFAGGLK